MQTRKLGVLLKSAYDKDIVIYRKVCLMLSPHLPEPRPPGEVYPDHSSPRIAVVLGAGFSHCADLPLQSEFETGLLTNDPNDPRDRLITSAIEEFLQFTFGWRRGDRLPPLEDIL